MKREKSSSQRKVKEILKASEKNPICKQLNPQELANIYTRIINQQTLKYTFRHTLQYFYKFIGFRNDKYLKQSESLKRHLYFKKGEDLLMNDLDVVKLVKRLHTLDVDQQVKWNTNEQLLLQLQKRKIIDSDTDDEDEFNTDRLKVNMLNF